MPPKKKSGGKGSGKKKASVTPNAALPGALAALASRLKAPVHPSPHRVLSASDSLLFIAVDNANLDDVRLLLKSGARPDAKNDNDATPLHVAAERGYGDILEVLLTSSPPPDVNVKERTASGGFTALHYAVKNKDIRCTEILLAHGADPNVQEGKMGFTALHLACRNGDGPMVTLLLGRGADAHRRDFKGNNPSAWAYNMEGPTSSVLRVPGLPPPASMTLEDLTVLHNEAKTKGYYVMRNPGGPAIKGLESKKGKAGGATKKKKK